VVGVAHRKSKQLASSTTEVVQVPGLVLATPPLEAVTDPVG